MADFYRFGSEISENKSASKKEQKKSYEPPRLVEWGTILSLTQGPLFGGQDDGVMGTGGI